MRELGGRGGGKGLSEIGDESWSASRRSRGFHETGGASEGFDPTATGLEVSWGTRRDRDPTRRTYSPLAAGFGKRGGVYLRRRSKGGKHSVLIRHWCHHPHARPQTNSQTDG